MPDPTEVATLNVGGVDFKYWESVWVKLVFTNPYPQFRFTCAEDSPVPPAWTGLKFKPGDRCTISLAGQLAITGIILVRQTAYDAHNHTVELYGEGFTRFATRSSVVHKTGKFDGMDIVQIANELVKPFGITAKGVGDGPGLHKPFDKMQVNPCENVWDTIERLARMRDVLVGNDEKANVLLIDNHSPGSGSSLREGVNIKKMQCTIDKTDIFKIYIVRNQDSGGDERPGRESSESEASADGHADHASIKCVVAEHPTPKDELQLRATSEMRWSEGTIIDATVTVQGWLNGSGQLWFPDQAVSVWSPMAMLSETLLIDEVTFTQDVKSGTLTTLKLVAPWTRKAMVSGGASDFPQPAPAQSTFNAITQSAEQILAARDARVAAQKKAFENVQIPPSPGLLP